MAKDRLRRSKLLLCFINGFYLHRLPNLPNREEPGKHRSHGCFKRLHGSCLFSWCESGQSLVCQEAWDFVFWDASASYLTFLSYYMYGCFAYMHVRAPHTSLVPVGVKRRVSAFLNSKEMGKNYPSKSKASKRQLYHAVSSGL